MDLKIVFSKRFLELRKSKNLSLVALGEILGVTNQAVSLIEKGKRATSFEILFAIAEYFNVSVDYLLGRTDNPEMNK